MIIDKIDYSHSYNLVILTIESEEFFIGYDLYNELSIFVDDDIDFETYKKILIDDEYNHAKNLALSKISYSQKTSFEVKKLLKSNGFSEDAIVKTIEFLESYGIIDDDSYVKSYINDKNNITKRSKNKIMYSLKSKNISDELINRYIDLITEEEELQKAHDFALKKARGDFSLRNKQKVYRYLSSKGFDFDIISKVVGDIFK